jgi:hypothetical protein
LLSNPLRANELPIAPPSTSFCCHAWLVVTPVGLPQLAPPSVERRTTRFLLFAAHPVPAAKNTALVCAYMLCRPNDHEVPPLVVFRMNPPPPPSVTVLALSIHTASTSERESILRFTLSQLEPLVVLRTHAPLRPAAQIVEPTKSTASRSLTLGEPMNSHGAPPAVVRITRPWLPTAHPVAASENETAFRSCVVVLVCGVQFAPPSVLLRMRPPAPTTYATEAVGKATALRRGAPVATAYDHVPPLLVLRQILPLSPTASTVKPWAATPRRVLFPRVPLLHATPPLRERKSSPLLPAAHTSMPSRENTALKP